MCIYIYIYIYIYVYIYLSRTKYVKQWRNIIMRVPLLNFEGSPGSWVPGSRGPGSWNPGLTFTPCHFLQQARFLGIRHFDLQYIKDRSNREKIFPPKINKYLSFFQNRGTSFQFWKKGLLSPSPLVLPLQLLFTFSNSSPHYAWHHNWPIFKKSWNQIKL